VEEHDSVNSRRDFLKGSLATITVGASLTTIAPEVFADELQSSKRLRLALMGTGGRGIFMWGPSVEKEFSDKVEMVGLCDINAKRVSYAQSLFASSPPTYTDFDKMIRARNPDIVIVATVDSTHAQYVIRAMELGCDVICEKPLATTAEDCQAIHEAEKRTGRKVTVTFNARHFSEKTKVKELLVNNAIGELYSIDYAEMLDLAHGASYFRRWHGIKANSGTLLVHKASHHFDQVNWWVGSTPDQVSAFGELRKYGSNGPYRSTHCRACTHKTDCPFYWDITQDENAMKLYVDCEQEDGYLRDACLYRKEIDIYDAMTVQCRYKNGVLLTYSLNAASPIEGQIITLNGSKGRIELRVFHQQPWKSETSTELRLVTNSPRNSQILPIAMKEGEHGGADRSLKRYIFRPETLDPLGHRAGSNAGIISSILGIAAYKSIETGQSVGIDELIDLS